MKKTLLLLALAASFAAQAQMPTTAAAPAATAAAPADAYTTMMAATISELMKSGEVPQLMQADAKLERAAAVAPQDWLPRYYQAYARVIACFVTKEGDEAKDKYLDQADAALAQARKLRGDESEVSALQAYIYQGRIMVSPMTRFMAYGGKVEDALTQAQTANPQNPRVLLLRGNNLYFRPKMVGGGAEAAKPFYDQAKVSYAAFKPASVLAPNWGERQLLGRLKQYETATSSAQ
ncbi:hypothetical protein KBK19_15755 [Microvirga sp. STR05]|uniref:Tetratricopeptide repeat protein n=1 Tax=Hymenobacter duratus TaxID=2771356 RepID=A0ABR8JI21_9BACT|nr:hypothetical protein [Hymenobacter duratus]MBD2716497.1 hypothetical protein [Hymenobacter duratus]MBR7951412.1 hypothetical protein [Microvirga sp. STR05]